MLRNWTELLPLFLIRRLTKEKCEVRWRYGMSVYIPRPGVMIQAEPFERTPKRYTTSKFGGGLSEGTKRALEWETGESIA